MLIVAGLLVIIGVAGSVLPLLPGVPLIFAGIVLYGWSTGFTTVDGRFIALSLALTVLSALLDWVAGSIGARRYGATSRGVIGALVGGIAGLLTFGPLGLFAGTFLGAAAGELLMGRSADDAMRAGWGSLVGLVMGTVARFAIAVSLAIMFFIRAV